MINSRKYPQICFLELSEEFPRDSKTSSKKRVRIIATVNQPWSVFEWMEFYCDCVGQRFEVMIFLRRFFFQTLRQVIKALSWQRVKLRSSVGQIFKVNTVTLRKHAYSNILKKFTTTKKKKKSDKNSDIFHIPAQNIDCGYSLEPPRWVPTIYGFSKVRKIMYTPVNPSFTI